MSIKIISPETLALIFEHTCPPVFPDVDAPIIGDHPSNGTLLTLTHVSSYWRQLAWATPELWCNLLLVHNQRYSLGTVPTLELHFKNARNRPFSLDITFADFETEPLPIHWKTIDTIQSMLFGDTSTYSNNIRALRLVYPPHHWPPTISTSFPRLQHLSIIQEEDSFESMTPMNLSLGNVTYLSSIHLDWVRGDLILPWSSITEIELVCVPLLTCVKALVECPNLIKYSCHCPQPDNDQPLNIGPIITAPYLQEFAWDTWRSQINLYLAALERIRLPALRRLSWTGEYEYARIEDDVRAMFSHLPDTLDTLRLECIHNWSPDLLAYVLQKSHSIRELTVALSERETINRVLRLLFPAQGHSAINHLPSLVKLNIQDISRHGWEGVKPNVKFSHLLLKICKKRLGEPKFKLFVEFKSHSIIWALGVREKLCAMVWEGFPLEVVDDRGTMVPRDEPVPEVSSAPDTENIFLTLHLHGPPPMQWPMSFTNPTFLPWSDGSPDGVSADESPNGSLDGGSLNGGSSGESSDGSLDGGSSNESQSPDYESPNESPNSSDADD